MKPIIIFPNNKDEITLKIEDFKEYINSAYYGGYGDGYEKGKDECKNELLMLKIKYEEFNTTPYCVAESTIQA